MSTFEIIHRTDNLLRACVVQARDAEDAQERFVQYFEDQGYVHGEILNIEEI